MSNMSGCMRSECGCSNRAMCTPVLVKQYVPAYYRSVFSKSCTSCCPILSNRLFLNPYSAFPALPISLAPSFPPFQNPPLSS